MSDATSTSIPPVRVDLCKLSRRLRACLEAGSRPAPAPDRVAAPTAVVAEAEPPVRPDWKGVILVLSGALNPVHNGHTAMLRAAGSAIESRLGATFVAGVLSPSSHSYVFGKLRGEAMTEKARNWLAALAVDGDPQLVVAPYGIASGSNVCHRLLQELKDYQAALRERRRAGSTDPGLPHFDGELLPERFPWDRLHVVPVYGSDFYIRYPNISSSPRVIVTRDDEEGTAEAARRLLQRQLESGEDAVDPQFCLLDIAAAGMVPPYSSTRVRAALQQPESTESQHYLAEALPPPVLGALRSGAHLFCHEVIAKRR